ncbi:MAG TPA: hypothetical protein VF263_02470 [Longimicrobiaceae bacterium]
MLQLVVPPVGPDSGFSEILRWLSDLEALRSECSPGSVGAAMIDWRVREALGWLVDDDARSPRAA